MISFSFTVVENKFYLYWMGRQNGSQELVKRIKEIFCSNEIAWGKHFDVEEAEH